ncbi:MAG: hypothetical protein Q9227_003479 [Pyrenula ochraceoflavens]
METLTTQSTGVAVILIALLTYICYQRYLSSLSGVPGPFLASFTSLWIANAYRRQDFHHYAIDLHKKYGPIVRVAPDGISVGDPGAIKIIYEQLQGKSNPNLLGLMNEKWHKELRRLIDPIYALKSIRESEMLMDEPIEFFAEQMRRKARNAVDIIEWMNVLATDIISAAFYGKRYGHLDRGNAPEMLEFTEAGWSTYFWVAMLPPLGKLARLSNMMKIMAKVILSGGKPPLPIFAWTKQQIEAQLTADSQSNVTPNLLEKFVRLHKERPDEFPKAALENQAFASVFAGFETCGATMPKIIWRIVGKEGCQARLQNELDAAKQQGRLPGLLNYDDLRQLPYLSACISEGFRMDPVTGLILSRQVPAGGVQLNGHHIPAGTEIGINPWVLSYNEDIMVQPNEFKPERWLEASKQEKMLMGMPPLLQSPSLVRVWNLVS